MDSTDNYEKIVFKFYSDLLEEYTVETIWAEIIDSEKGYFKIDNIPFYAPLVASGDVIFAEFEEVEQRYVYRETVEPSGNSTIQVVIMNDEVEIGEIRRLFEEMSCPSEKVNRGYFSMEVPFEINYYDIKAKLAALSAEGTIDYAESCLSEKHWSEIGS